MLTYENAIAELITLIETKDQKVINDFFLNYEKKRLIDTIVSGTESYKFLCSEVPKVALFYNVTELSILCALSDFLVHKNVNTIAKLIKQIKENSNVAKAPSNI